MSKIIGNPTTTPVKIPDWDQNDERKSDFIKNRPLKEIKAVRGLTYYKNPDIEPSDEGLFAFTLNDDGTSYSIKSNWDMEFDIVYDVVIPYEHNGMPVTIIGGGAFSNCDLENIEIPNSVTIIGNGAFSGCNSLTTVTIGSGVTSIGDLAFSSCYCLTSIDIPDGVTSIGDRAFASCISLTSINIPDSVTSIGEYAFFDCADLTNAKIPNSVINIGNDAFTDCENVTISCSQGSYAEQYAKDNNINYRYTEISKPDSTPIENSNNLITSGGVYDLTANILEKLNKCFSFEEGYENEIDSYAGGLLGTLYKINPPNDMFTLYWDYYYIYARESNNRDVLQVKFFEDENGISFRTGKAKGDNIEWNEWIRTLLSDEVDNSPTEGSLNLITSGGVFKALKEIPSGGGGEAVAQPPFTFEASCNVYPDGRCSLLNFETLDNITEAFNSGRMVFAYTTLTYVNEDENPLRIDGASLIATSPYTFFGVTNSNEHVFATHTGSGEHGWICYVSDVVNKDYVDSAIGDIEASLENIINKYGLGGEA